MKRIYKDAAAVAWDSCERKWDRLILFLSGVLQGCPASAFLFTIALDPSLHSFENALCQRAPPHASSNTLRSKSGIMRACADDLGAALRSLRLLTLLEPIFETARTVAGLNLKPKKCVLVVLVPFNGLLKTKIQEWLALHLPKWKNFNIQDAGKYLGFWLGPAAGAHLWDAPFKKFRLRVDKIYSSGAAVSVPSLV